jgi:hypothetical protein
MTTESDIEQLDSNIKYIAENCPMCASGKGSPRPGDSSSRAVESPGSQKLLGESWYPKGTPASSLPDPLPKHRWAEDWDGDWVHTSSHPNAPTDWSKAIEHQAEKAAKGFKKGLALKSFVLVLILSFGGFIGIVGNGYVNPPPPPITPASDFSGDLADMIYADRHSNDATYHLLKLNELQRCNKEAGVEEVEEDD